MAISLFDKDSGARLGAVDAETWAHVTAILQKEHATDDAYWIDAGTLELLEKDAAEVASRPAGAGPFRTDETGPAAPSALTALVTMLRAALGDREGFDVSWREEG